MTLAMMMFTKWLGSFAKERCEPIILIRSEYEEDVRTVMIENLINFLFNELTSNKVRRSKHPREISYGDVVCIDDGFLKRYAIWTGDNFILYGKDKNCFGLKVVHEESFGDFLQNVEHYAICEFPDKYGHPKEWELPSTMCSVVMPQDKIWRMIMRAHKARKYKRYSPDDTVSRAKSQLGECGFLTSEHFAMWCKTGIAESHQIEKMREWWDMIIVY